MSSDAIISSVTESMYKTEQIEFIRSRNFISRHLRAILLIDIDFALSLVLSDVTIIDSHRADDTIPENNEDLELGPHEAKDYFLPPVFSSHDEEDDDDDNPYLDYDYDKETNYKDSPDVATVKSNAHTNEGAVDDKIPLHTTKDNLPIFLLEPENTYVVKNKPAILKCRAANALEVSKVVKLAGL